MKVSIDGKHVVLKLTGKELNTVLAAMDLASSGYSGAYRDAVSVYDKMIKGIQKAKLEGGK